jgi:glycosyltransferase involved in cell wall biosynthesis
MTLDSGAAAVQSAHVGDRKTVMIFGSDASYLVNLRGPLIAAIVGRGHDVVAVAPDISSSQAATIRELGAQPHELQLVNQSLNPLATVRALRELKRLIRACRPDVLIAYTIKPVVLGAIAGAAEGVPKIVSLITGAGYAFSGGLEPRRLISRIAATQLYKFALHRSDWTVFQNPDDEKLFRELGMVRRGQKVCRINGSGVDLRHFTPAPMPPGPPSFLMVSRLLKGKGVGEFATAAKRLKRQHPEVPVHLVGYIDGSPDSISEADLKDIRNGGVEFHGRLSDVRPAIAACSVYVLPSRYREGTPRSVLEAMAMGRAIITTDAPGCRETVRDGINGFLVPPRDADGLYQAMMRFVADPDVARRMGRESRKIAESKYDVDRVNADLLRIAEL